MTNLEIYHLSKQAGVWDDFTEKFSQTSDWIQYWIGGKQIQEIADSIDTRGPQTIFDEDVLPQWIKERPQIQELLNQGIISKQKLMVDSGWFDAFMEQSRRNHKIRSNHLDEINNSLRNLKSDLEWTAATTPLTLGVGSVIGGVKSIFTGTKMYNRLKNLKGLHTLSKVRTKFSPSANLDKLMKRKGLQNKILGLTGKGSYGLSKFVGQELGEDYLSKALGLPVATGFYRMKPEHKSVYTQLPSSFFTHSTKALDRFGAFSYQEALQNIPYSKVHNNSTIAVLGPKFYNMASGNYDMSPKNESPATFLGGGSSNTNNSPNSNSTTPSVSTNNSPNSNSTTPSVSTNNSTTANETSTPSLPSGEYKKWLLPAIAAGAGGLLLA